MTIQETEAPFIGCSPLPSTNPIDVFLPTCHVTTRPSFLLEPKKRGREEKKDQEEELDFEWRLRKAVLTHST